MPRLLCDSGFTLGRLCSLLDGSTYLDKVCCLGQLIAWTNLASLHLVAVTTGISYACANFIATVATVNTTFVPEAKHIIGIYAGVLITQGWCQFTHHRKRTNAHMCRIDQHFWSARRT